MKRPDMERPDSASDRGLLKDFQQRTVDAVFDRLYGPKASTRRFLVADEVGLGKTLVARGLISKVIEHLWDTVGRIDIIYVCSNAEIARQNVNRLTPRGVEGVSLASRITLLPIQAQELKERRINVVALTPGTSLDLKGNLGVKRERALLVHMLSRHWEPNWTGLCRLFTGGAKLSTFKEEARSFGREYPLDAGLERDFQRALEKQCDKERAAGSPTLRDRLEDLVKDFATDASGDGARVQRQRKLIGEFRQVLARSCIDALEPDLIILDEFQRFKELLSGDGPAAEMAQQLFAYENAEAKSRVLLLSATPYKMYTIADDAEGEDHYRDFLRTAQFLLNETPDRAVELGELLKAFRREIRRIGHAERSELDNVRARIEQILRGVMVRTERLAVTSDRSGMLVEKQVGSLGLKPRDAVSYVQFQEIARHVEYPDTLEFWKAAPWLLNFMEGYKLRERFDGRFDDEVGGAALAKAVAKAGEALLDREAAETFQPLDPPHARMRWLREHTLDGGLWQLLWMPPSLPYYQLGMPFAAVAATKPTKALIFSAWRVVPRVIAAALSHEAERRMYRLHEGDSADIADAPERLGDQLQVTRKRGKAAGLTTAALLYPSVWLARFCDPLTLSRTYHETNGRLPTVEEIVQAAELVVAQGLEKVIPSSPERTTPDESWYWAAPVLLDVAINGRKTRTWLDSDLGTAWAGNEPRGPRSPVIEELDEAADESGPDETEDTALEDMLERMRGAAAGDSPTGTPPRDLVRVLALMGLAGPATCALRALARTIEGGDEADDVARTSAARIGGGFRTLFNQPDATAIVRATTTRADYWKQCLQYCAHGGLQSTLDEYAHVLVGDAGLFGGSVDRAYDEVARAMLLAVSLRRATVGAHAFASNKRTLKEARLAFRSRFAMRFGEERADESGEKTRADDVRKAFNSPFWPFVLATTSVGQEGLDFHLYCHAVIHWNLPPNPVDMEQREGRVHRFKGHAVRKNVAQQHGQTGRMSAEADPWTASFAAARAEHAGSSNELIPYWVYTAPDGAQIERYVPTYPLSRDALRYEQLRRSLALYRMVFGQPRQEELLAYLSRVLPADQIQATADRLRISLEP